MTAGIEILLFQHFNRESHVALQLHVPQNSQKLACKEHMRHFVAIDEQNTQIVCRYFFSYSSSNIKQSCG